MSSDRGGERPPDESPTPPGSQPEPATPPSPIIGQRATSDAQPGTSAATSQNRGTGFVPIDFMQTMMQEMMSKLIQTTANAFGMPNTKPVPRVRNLEHIYVPAFDPDDRTDTIEVWCRNLDELKTECELTDRETLNLSRKHLRGRAAEWARRNYTTLTTWPELKTRLIETFADEARYYDDLMLFMEYTSDQAGSLAEYATRKWELAKKAVGVAATEERLVEAVISGMSDFRIRSDLLRLTPKTLPQLIQSLNSYKRNRPTKDTDHNIANKRPKPNTTDSNKQSKRCHNCHKLGHLQKDCRLGVGSPTSQVVPKPLPSTSKEIQPSVTSCTFCSKKGHTSNNCFQRLNKINKDEKSVNVKFIDK